MSNRKPQIFIISTFADLAEYRNAVIEAVLEAGAMPISIGILHAETSSIELVTQEALRRSDAALVLVGHRYGIINPKTNTSWVETEYDEALKRGIPLFVFLAADDSSWPLKFIDQDQRRIREFRHRLTSNLSVGLFSKPDDLRRLTKEALSQWVMKLERGPIAEPRRTLQKREIRIVRLLLSSPGDVSDERERVARAVFRFNQDSVEDNGLFIKLVRWEDMAPQIGPKAQEVINKQIGVYHLFCGIMWNRFGTPTEIAASGTKEEFDGAVKCWRTDGRPWISFYFCDRPANFTTPEQLEQKRHVLEFRAELYEMGVVRNFQTTQDFEDKIYEDLKRIAKNPEFLKMLASA
jgi:Domain of unknown function (DUF4062)